MIIVITAGAAFLIGLIVTPLLIRFAHVREIYDHADHRKIHDGGIPALGGVGIVVSFVAASGLGYALLAAGGEVDRLLPWYHGSIVVGLVGMHVLGVVDDLVDIPALRKLALQLIAAGVIVSGGIAVDRVSFPVLGISFSLGAWGAPLTVVWIISIANAVNLTDGIDGFCGGFSLIAAAAFAVLAFLGGGLLMEVFVTAFVGAVAAFLVFNVPPARIFMGDGGSLFAGTFLATVAVMPSLPEGSELLVAVPPVLFAIPIMDTVAALLRRSKRNLPVHQPDQEHFHHLLLAAAGGPRRALAVAYPLFVLLAAVAVLYAAEPGVATATALVAVTVALGALHIFLHRRLAGRAVRAGVGRAVRAGAGAAGAGAAGAGAAGAKTELHVSTLDGSAGSSRGRPAATPKNGRTAFAATPKNGHTVFAPGRTNAHTANSRKRPQAGGDTEVGPDSGAGKYSNRGGAG